MHEIVDDSLAAAAHQLGEGLVLLQTYTAMVGDVSDVPTDVVEGLEHVCNRLRRLDDALLHLARLKRRPPVPAPIDSSQALSAAHRLLTDGHETVIVHAEPEPLPGVQGDPAHIESLFLHALRQVAVSGPGVSVSALREDGVVRFHVDEEGAPPGSRPGAHRAPEARPRCNLDVEVCRRIVGSHGGEMWLDPDGPGLTFTLPAAVP